MFLVFFALWLVFNGRWTTEIALTGLALSAVLYAFCWKFIGYGPKHDLAALKRLPKMLRYAVTVVVEIVKANWALTRIVLSHKTEVHPQLVTFHTPVSGPIAKSVLAESITLTPGTITVLSEGGDLTVHCLDTQFMQGIDDTVFQKQLLEMEDEKHGD